MHGFVNWLKIINGVSHLMHIHVIIINYYSYMHVANYYHVNTQT